jgi:hypothetical protein
MACAAHTENGTPAKSRSKPLHPSSSQPVQVRTAKNAANTAMAKPVLNPLIMAQPPCGGCWPRHEFFSVYPHFGHFLHRTANSVDIFAIERPRRGYASAVLVQTTGLTASDDADRFPHGWRPCGFGCRRLWISLWIGMGRFANRSRGAWLSMGRSANRTTSEALGFVLHRNRREVLASRRSLQSRGGCFDVKLPPLIEKLPPLIERRSPSIVRSRPNRVNPSRQQIS